MHASDHCLSRSAMEDQASDAMGYLGRDEGTAPSPPGPLSPVILSPTAFSPPATHDAHQQQSAPLQGGLAPPRKTKLEVEAMAKRWRQRHGAGTRRGAAVEGIAGSDGVVDDAVVDEASGTTGTSLLSDDDASLRDDATNDDGPEPGSGVGRGQGERAGTSDESCDRAIANPTNGFADKKAQKHGDHQRAPSNLGNGASRDTGAGGLARASPPASRPEQAGAGQHTLSSAAVRVSEIRQMMNGEEEQGGRAPAQERAAEIRRILAEARDATAKMAESRASPPGRRPGVAPPPSSAAREAPSGAGLGSGSGTAGRSGRMEGSGGGRGRGESGALSGGGPRDREGAARVAAQAWERERAQVLSLSQSIRSNQIGKPRKFLAPKLTGVYRTLIVSSGE